MLLRGGVNVRSAPSLSGPLVNYYDHLVLLRVTRGPVCANDYNWWYVEGIGEPGWVIEGRPGRYFLEAYVDPATTDCSAPLETIQAGGQLETVTGSRVRAIPSNDADVVTVVQPGQTLTVLDGPRCADHLNWWHVRAPYGTTSTLVDGWIAEGYPIRLLRRRAERQRRAGNRLPHRAAPARGNAGGGQLPRWRAAPSAQRAGHVRTASSPNCSTASPST